MSSLQRELRMSKPFASRRLEAYLGLVRTADLLAHLSEDYLAAHDLSTTTYNILRILKGAGDDGLPVGAIGERLITREPDVTRLVDRLERRALVVRARAAHDRRVVLVSLTSAGRGLIESIPMDTAMHEALAPYFSCLSAAELASFITMCDRIRATPHQG
jgi:DNA-binding MarR family transcriptional regulator